MNSEYIFDEKIQTELKEVGVSEKIETVKVSIIVPVFNTEKYIAKCLLSLVKQTLKEIEIVVVDDGSSDNSSKIISEFQKNDSRIKVLHQENQKQGAARNNGTKLAVGEYIGYVDSDDWVDLDFFEKLYSTAKKYNSDIALAANVRIGNNKIKNRLNIEREEFVTTLQEKIDISKQVKNPCPTNKIYKLKMLKENNIVWPEGVYCEDKLFTIQAVYYANGIVTVPNVQYYYFRNPNSTVNNKAKQHLLKTKQDKIKAKQDVLKFLKDKKADIRDKEFWALKKDYRFLNIPILTIKESLKTEKYYLFNYIKIGEKTE